MPLIPKLNAIIVYSEYISIKLVVFKRNNFRKKIDDFCKPITLIFGQKLTPANCPHFFEKRPLISKLNAIIVYSEYIQIN